MDPIPFQDEIDSECALYVKREGSCVGDDVLYRILGRESADALEELKKETRCDTELCVIQSSKAANRLSRDEQEHLVKYFFKVKGPSKPTEWLSNFDIDDILDQAVKRHPEFLHITFQMRDFAEVNNDPTNAANLANLDWPLHYKEGKRCFATVMNTDYSSGRGLHWFALFGDFREEPYTLEYFNSSGELPLKEVKRWLLESAAKWSAAMAKPVAPVIVSRVQHQKDNYSCGTYALYYILTRLYGTSHRYFNGGFVKDETMYAFRRRLFR